MDSDDLLSSSSFPEKDIFADNYSDALPTGEDIKAAIKFLMVDLRSMEHIVPDSEEARTLAKNVGILEEVWNRRDELSNLDNVRDSGWSSPHIREYLLKGKDYQTELYRDGVLKP